MSLDELTSKSRGALRFLFVQHPTRTSYGILFSTVLDFAKDLIRPSFHDAVNWEAITPLRLMIVGVLVFHFPLLFRKHALPETIESQFSTIERATKAGGITALQKRMLYQSLAQQIITDTRLKPGVEKTVSEATKPEQNIL
jgi:hypothetical protein